LAKATKQLDMTKWPAPIVRLYLGELTPDALASAADALDSATKRGRLCEANFYGAEFLLQQGAKDEAARRFALAAAGCPAGLIEATAATVELKALGAQ
jgi:lipoprotein NlpI